MTLPTVKGTESTVLWEETDWLVGTTTVVRGILFEWVAPSNLKAIKIPSGTANGLAVKVVNGVASAAVDVMAEIVELNY
jgi:hypothetical protein